MIRFPLKTETFEEVENGARRIEYRAMTSYWNTRISNSIQAVYKNECIPCRFTKGYAAEYIDGLIYKIDVVPAAETELKDLKDVTQYVYKINFYLMKDETLILDNANYNIDIREKFDKVHNQS